VHPWSGSPLRLTLATPGRRGDDRLRLRFGIDADGLLRLEGEDLQAEGVGPAIGPLQLGPVR
jgi:hypothetical protein